MSGIIYTVWILSIVVSGALLGWFFYLKFQITKQKIDVRLITDGDEDINKCYMISGQMLFVIKVQLQNLLKERVGVKETNLYLKGKEIMMRAEKLYEISNFDDKKYPKNIMLFANWDFIPFNKQKESIDGVEIFYFPEIVDEINVQKKNIKIVYELIDEKDKSIKNSFYVDIDPSEEHKLII